MASLIFDLDGTLIDSAPDLHGASARLLRELGQEPLPFSTIKSFIGNGVPTLVERIMGAVGLEASEHSALTQRFLEIYGAHATDLTQPYPNVPEVLSQLQAAGHKLAVCTNKPEAPARSIMDALDLTRFFDVVVGGDTFPTKKPNPEGALWCADALGGSPSVFIGDSEVDAATAQNAGMPFALFTEGYRKASVSDIKWAFAFKVFAELAVWLDEQRS